MRDDSAALREWRLQVRFFDNSESASFPTRQEAIEHAEALLKDYDGSVGIDLIDPWGGKEILRESPFTARDGAHGTASGSKYYQ